MLFWTNFLFVIISVILLMVFFTDNSLLIHYLYD